HERNRVGVFDCRDGLPQRKTVARWRPHRTLGRLGPGRGRAPVPQSHRLSPDSVAAIVDGQRGGQEAGCQTSRGRVTYENRGSLTFNDVPDNRLIELARRLTAWIRATSSS